MRLNKSGHRQPPVIRGLPLCRLQVEPLEDRLSLSVLTATP
jgi:hypothetical protein